MGDWNRCYSVYISNRNIFNPLIFATIDAIMGLINKVMQLLEGIYPVMYGFNGLSKCAKSRSFGNVLDRNFCVDELCCLGHCLCCLVVVV